MRDVKKNCMQKVWCKLAVAFMALAVLVMICPISAYAKVTTGTLGYYETVTWTYDSDTRILTVTGEGGYSEWAELRDLASGKMRQIIIEDAVIRDNVSYMFAGLEKVESITFHNVDTSEATNMANMFDGCKSLTSLDLSEFDTGNVTNMYAMFYGCSGLTSLNVSSFDTFGVADMQLMFGKCSSLTELDLSNFNTANVTNMNGLFKECSNLTDLDLSGLDVSNVEMMGEMFAGCSALKDLNLSKFNTENVRDMEYMFNGCSALTELDLSSFDTECVESMKGMFKDCTALKTLNTSSFRTGIVTNMKEMFYNCSSLDGLDLSGFDTEYVANMNYMFYNCSGLTALDLSSFDTSSLYETQYMFYNCSKLTELDLSSLDLSNVWYMGWELAGARKIKTIHTPSAMRDGSELVLPDFYYDKAGNKYDKITADICNMTLTREPSPFADVPESSWQYEYVKFVYNRELMKGKSTNAEGYIIFDPNKEMTRAEFVQTLYNKEGKPAVYYDPLFKDVPKGQWYTNAILWAANHNIVAGKGNGYFDVSGNITRQEMATILCKYAKNYRGYNCDEKAELDAFTDVDSISSWAVDNMKWAIAYNIMKGKGEEIAPQDNATRAECATMLRNFMFTFEPYYTY